MKDKIKEKNKHWDRETAAGVYNTETPCRRSKPMCVYCTYVLLLLKKTKKSIYIGHGCMCICLKWADKRKDKVQKNKIKVKITLYHPHHRGKTEAPSGVSWVGRAGHWVVFSWHPDSQEDPQIVDKTAVEKLCFVQKHLQSLLRWTTTCPATRSAFALKYRSTTEALPMNSLLHPPFSNFSLNAVIILALCSYYVSVPKKSVFIPK